MSGLLPLLDSHDLVPPLNSDEGELVAKELASDVGMTVYAKSITACNGKVYFLARDGMEKKLCIMAKDAFDEFDGDLNDCPHGKVKVCERTHANADLLRKTLPFTKPGLVGPSVSLGMGDRLGVATAGHIRAIRGTGMKPILCQQSIREMARTGRSPDNVMDDASWGVFEEGYRDGFGSDADHLKNTEDIDNTFAAGFRMFTIDPGDYVDNAAGEDSLDVLKEKLAGVPWDELETTEEECRASLMKRIQIGHDMALEFDEETFLRAVVKYGKPVAHTVRLYRYILEVANGEEFELEMSVDETDSPTTIHEHFYVAHELKRLGVNFTSLAPRFIGDFEKGIDYKGDLAAFEDAYIQHAQVARFLGPYKISIHSGSDKFTVYPIAAKHTGEMVHVKTAGTSYLEALRAVGEIDPPLFREVWAYALGRYDEDKKTYHVSADLTKVPNADDLADNQLGTILDGNDGRQVLHVTYGSVLNEADEAGNLKYKPRMMDALRSNEEVHYRILGAHMKKHIDPFVK
jgi:tagaturonate epimerase